jgi:hypothetical protein
MATDESRPRRGEERTRLAPRRPRKRALVASPHDIFFRAIFSRPGEATGLIRAMLPAPLAEGLDPGSVTLLSPAHVDGVLRASQSDLLLSARLFDTSVRFVAILEHRSTVEHRMALRLLRYSAETWARESRVGEPLPDVIPLVVYAGKRRWTAPRDLAGLLVPTSEPALHALRPRFTYLLEDLTALGRGALRAQALGPLGELALVTLRAVQRGGLRAALSELIPLVRDLSGIHDGPEALTVLLRYLLTVVPEPEQPAVHAIVAALPSPEEEEEAVKKVRTIADALRDEGAARAHAEAEAKVRTIADALRDEGARARAEIEARLRAEAETRIRETETRVREATVAKQLQLKFGPLPSAVRERLGRASAQDLDGVAERLLFAATLEAALGPA